MKKKNTKAVVILEISPWLSSKHTSGGSMRKITFWDICNDCEIITWHYEHMNNSSQWDFIDDVDLYRDTVLIEGDFRYKSKISKTENLPILNMDSKIYGYKVLTLEQAYALCKHRPEMARCDVDEYEYVCDPYTHSSKYSY